MNFFLIPKKHTVVDLTQLKFECKDISDICNDECYINNTLFGYLQVFKQKIEGNVMQWEKYKKVTNPYENIHNFVDMYKPLSRSFFKMIEMCNIFQLTNSTNNFCPNFKSFHLAEGPGGFIEALQFLRKNPSDEYYGMTLHPKNNNDIPGWNRAKQFLKENSNVKITYGEDNTGNLLCKKNLEYIIDNHYDSCQIVTADGGFDFSVDYNKQEHLASNLIFVQIVYAIALQHLGGHFILKIFDVFQKITADFLYLLEHFYEEVYIMKPNTSRTANSEKYIVCKNFQVKNRRFFLQHVLQHFDFDSKEILTSIFEIKHDLLFLTKLIQINSIFGQQQLENIHNTILLINSPDQDKIANYKKKHHRKVLGWCKKHNFLEYSTSYLKQQEQNFGAKY